MHAFAAHIPLAFVAGVAFAHCLAGECGAITEKVRVPLAGFVLGRGRGVEQSGVHYGAAAQQQGALLKVGFDRAKQRLGQRVALQKVAEIEDCRFIRNGVMGEVQPAEIPHRMHVIKRLFSAGIGKPIPLLQKIYP